MHRIRLMVAAALAVLNGCAEPQPGMALSAGQRAGIAREVERALREAYDLSKPDVADRMLALYGDSGRVISASSGRVVASRDTLSAGIRYFWNNVGFNMRNPRWEWEQFYVDALSPTAAVVTATYRIPHRNPRNEPHVLGGAITAVFEKRAGKWVIVQEHLSDLPQTDADSSDQS